MTSAEFLDLSVYATFVMVMLSLAIAFVRLALGPTLLKSAKQTQSPRTLELIN